MQLKDLVTLRRDLMFQGAVQISWYETDPQKARKAAENFVFHGPKYHGVSERDFGHGQAYRLKDTVSFTLDVLKHLGGNGSEATPMMLAAAGYGTGKSHLGLTLAVLLSDSFETSRQRILANLKEADEEISSQIEFLLQYRPGPYLVIAINGMQDFDLAEEIRRQVLIQLRKRGLTTEVLEKLRPRFQTAKQFTISFFETHRTEFVRHFGEACTKEDICAFLEAQDEAAFRRVNAIYEVLMQQSIVAVGRESLQEFLGTFALEYCGNGKAFQGLVIIFDEFGRYLEFAVQRPHVAGPQGLQQLFEGVQDNARSIFLLCFVQSELRAYVSRIPPELRDQLERFVTRYDTAPKARLSTNLETIIANLLHKRDLPTILQILKGHADSKIRSLLMEKMRRWFPEMRHHALWADPVRFARVVQEGCWPLHPATTWLLYSLSAVGKSLQQRSALSFLDDVIRDYENVPLDGAYWTIPPVALCTEAMIAEFKTSEEFGDSGALASAYDEVVDRYKYELKEDQKKILKAVLLAAKTGLSVPTEEEFIGAAAVLAGIDFGTASTALENLKKEQGILEWNEALHRYEIIGNAIPRRVFLRFLAERVRKVSSEIRAQLFRAYGGMWAQIDRIDTDYGRSRKVSTGEWRFAVTFTKWASLQEDIQKALNAWIQAFGVDEYRGQVLLCYVGPRSDIKKVRETLRRIVDDATKGFMGSSGRGAPLAVLLLYDVDGGLGDALAEYWILEKESDQESFSRFAHFIADHKKSRREWIERRIQTFLKTIQEEDIAVVCKDAIAGGFSKDVFEKIFETVYPNLVPFPFDGFHTVRGNAAKDCMQFTRDLFLGNLNQTAIASYNPQQKNRSVTVLDKTWRIFLADGNVSRRPGNRRVAFVIDLLEKLLLKNRSVNLGQAFRILCGPPFGCNLASAGLILGVFFAPRREEIQLRYRGKIKPVEEWLGIAIEKNFFDLVVLDHTDIEQLGDGQQELWNSLLDTWERETTFEGRVAIYKKALLVVEEHPVPPGLRDRFELRKRDAEEALRNLERYQETLEEQRAYAARAYERSNSGNLARCACEFQDLLHRLREDGPVWTPEQIATVEKELNKFRLSAAQYFETWLSEQIEMDPMKYGQFEKRMTKSAENFEKLSFPGLAQRVREQVDRVKRDLEKLQRLKTIFEEVDTFLAATRINPTTKVLEIRNSLNRITELEKKVKEAFQAHLPVSRLNEIWDRLQQLKRSGEAQLRAHKERAETIWNRNLHAIDDVREMAQQVGALLTLYDGLEEDVRDFLIMQRVLNLIEEHYRNMNTLTISASELDQRYATAVADIKGALDEDDEIPWSIEGTLGKLKENIEETRRQKAQKWMAQHVPTSKRILTLRAEDILEIRRQLITAPPYLTPQQMEMVRLTLAACSKRLEALSVDGLVAQFEELSPEAQKEFLRRVLQLAQSLDLRRGVGG